MDKRAITDNVAFRFFTIVSDGYNNPGNQSMGYYGGTNGMDGNMAQGMNRMNNSMGGMNARPGNMAGRNIHINPKFQNLAGMPNISAATTPAGGFSPNPNAGGAKSATWDNNRSNMSPARSTRPSTESNSDYQRDRQSVSLPLLYSNFWTITQGGGG